MDVQAKASTAGQFGDACQALKEDLLQEWQAFRAEVLGEVMQLIQGLEGKARSNRPEWDSLASHDGKGISLAGAVAKFPLPKRQPNIAGVVIAEEIEVDTRGVAYVFDIEREYEQIAPAEDFPCTPRRHSKAQDDLKTPEKLAKPPRSASLAASFRFKEVTAFSSVLTGAEVEEKTFAPTSHAERQQRRRRQARLHMYQMDADDDEASNAGSSLEDQFEASWAEAEAAAVIGKQHAVNGDDIQAGMPFVPPVEAIDVSTALGLEETQPVRGVRQVREYEVLVEEALSKGGRQLCVVLRHLSGLPVLEMLQVHDILRLHAVSAAAVDHQVLAHHLAQSAELSRPSSLFEVWEALQGSPVGLRPAPFANRVSWPRCRDEILATFANTPLLQKRYWCFQWCMAQTRTNRRPWNNSAREHALLAVEGLRSIFCELFQADHSTIDFLVLLARNGCEEVRRLVAPVGPALLQHMLSERVLHPAVTLEARDMAAACHHVLEISERKAWVGLAVDFFLLAADEQDGDAMDFAVHMLELLCGDITPAEARTCFHSEVLKMDVFVQDLKTGTRQAPPSKVQWFLHLYT